MQLALLSTCALLPNILNTDGDVWPVCSPWYPHSGRCIDTVVVNTTIDADAAEILRHYAPPGHTGTGEFSTQFFVQAS